MQLMCRRNLLKTILMRPCSVSFWPINEKWRKFVRFPSVNCLLSMPFSFFDRILGTLKRNKIKEKKRFDGWCNYFAVSKANKSTVFFSLPCSWHEHRASPDQWVNVKLILDLFHRNVLAGQIWQGSRLSQKLCPFCFILLLAIWKLAYAADMLYPA